MADETTIAEPGAAEDSMTSESFLESELQPTLEKMGMYTKGAEKLLLMTACHESQGFKYKKQIAGPALSYFQMEPNTLNDLYDNYLTYRPDKQKLLDQFQPEGMSREQALANNNAYACAAARLQYSRVPAALPASEDDVGMSEYCKQYWNTEAGKATPQKYLDDYNRYKPEGYE